VDFKIKYEIQIKPLAEKDLRMLRKSDSVRIIKRIMQLADGLKGDIKKLTKYNPEYRLRVGNYRILFDIEDTLIKIYRVIHRKEAYK